ncbi:hypothetical protein TeGR_g13222 [Tetraparma gracilis]|jgi:hypothetical protein|uniref:Uncharacterized protein n=1 Tax=Tetraparma gracilis TaxID=2962635 RepID=A0ABQ6N6R7_9STRA|nr:hypothetical protein TeGR_g13222 [Tetraparma gracilis]
METPAAKAYPQTAQICFSSLRRGGDGIGSEYGGIVICPEGYDFCVKEEVVPPVELGVQNIAEWCGSDPEFFGDTFEDSEKKCILRKCGDMDDCDPARAQTSKFYSDEDGRKRFCCGDKPGFRGSGVANGACNDGHGRFGGSLATLVCLVCLVAFILIR